MMGPAIAAYQGSDKVIFAVDFASSRRPTIAAVILP
jgi:hypothetical protein